MQWPSRSPMKSVWYWKCIWSTSTQGFGQALPDELLNQFQLEQLSKYISCSAPAPLSQAHRRCKSAMDFICSLIRAECPFEQLSQKESPRLLVRDQRKVHVAWPLSPLWGPRKSFPRFVTIYETQYKISSTELINLYLCPWKICTHISKQSHS